MYADQLKSLLADGGITPGNVRRLSELSEKWFMDEASLTAYVLRSIFRELLRDREWDDSQGIPTAEYTAFKENLLPQLVKLSTSIPTGTQERPIAALTDLVRAFRDCYAKRIETPQE
jgi:hypothetical protein